MPSVQRPHAATDLTDPREGEPARVLVFRWLDAYEQRLLDT